MKLSHTKQKFIKIGSTDSPFYKTVSCFPMYKITQIQTRESYIRLSTRYFMTRLIILPDTIIHINPSSNKHRLNKAVVDTHFFFDRTDQCPFETTYSIYDSGFKYEIHTFIKPTNTFYGYEDWLEAGKSDASCESGIHAFFTQEHAKSYVFEPIVYIKEKLICADRSYENKC